MADRGTPDPKREQDIDWAKARARIRSQVRHQLGGDDPSLDDLTQQALIVLLRVVRREGAKNLEGLIAAVARGTAVDEIRRRQREREAKGRLEGEPPPGPEPDGQGSDLQWFLLVQYLRKHDPHGHALAVAYADLGDWRRVAESLGQGYDATRQQWSRSARRFLESQRRDPGPSKDWLDDV